MAHLERSSRTRPAGSGSAAPGGQARGSAEHADSLDAADRAFLTALITAIPTPAFVKDEQHRLVQLNDAFCQMIGRPAATLLGTTVFDVLPPDEARSIHAKDELALSTGLPQQSEERLTDASGVRHRIVSRKSLVRVPGGGRYLLGVIADITELRRAEEERSEAAERELVRARAQLVDSLEALPAGFVLYDAEDRLVLTNSTYTRLYGGKVDPPGTRFEDALRVSLARGAYPAAIGREEEWLAERMATHRASQGSFEQQLSNGRWLRVIERRTSDGGTVGVRIDITDSKRHEQELQRAKDAADAGNRIKTEFLANMSHELRTPLNAIIGFSEAMLHGIVGGPLPPQQQEYVGDIHRSGLHLLDLINDVLDISKIDVGHLELRREPVDVASLVESCDRLVRGKAEESGVRLLIQHPTDPLPALDADAVRLKQILINLLSNAIKFTEAGGKVTLDIRSAAHEISFAVVDTGIGMRPEDIPMALQPFRQIDGSLARRHEGTGLGLPLAKRLAELHGGSLDIESAPGQGTRVVVRLPYRNPDAA